MPEHEPDPLSRWRPRAPAWQSGTAPGNMFPVAVQHCHSIPRLGGVRLNVQRSSPFVEIRGQKQFLAVFCNESFVVPACPELVEGPLPWHAVVPRPA